MKIQTQEHIPTRSASVTRLAACSAMLVLAACSTGAERLAGRPVSSTQATASAPITHRQVADFADLFYRQKKVRLAFETHVVENYIQHAAGMAQGREASIVGLEKFFARPGLSIEPQRILVDGNMAVIFLKANLPDGSSSLVMDLFRAENGKLVEHWDLKQPVAKDKEAGLFGGLTALR